jgi:hypothetical protein
MRPLLAVDEMLGESGYRYWRPSACWTLYRRTRGGWSWRPLSGCGPGRGRCRRRNRLGVVAAGAPADGDRRELLMRREPEDLEKGTVPKE